VEGGVETDLVQASMSGEQEMCQKYTDLIRVPISFITGGRLNCEKGTRDSDHPDQASFHLNTVVLQGYFNIIVYLWVMAYYFTYIFLKWGVCEQCPLYQRLPVIMIKNILGSYDDDC
jgi:hypothetical protein